MISGKTYQKVPIKEGSWQSHRQKYQCVWKYESEDEFTQDQYNRCIYHWKLPVEYNSILGRLQKLKHKKRMKRMKKDCWLKKTLT